VPLGRHSLSWDLPMHGDPVWGEPDAEEVLRRING